MVYTSCKTSYNVLSQLGTGLNCPSWRGGGESLIFEGGGVMQKKESQDFRFPELGISGLCTTTTANTLIAVVHLTINNFCQFPAFTCYFHCSIISCHFIHSILMTHFTSNYYTLIIKIGMGSLRGRSRGRVQGVRTPPHPLR